MATTKTSKSRTRTTTAADKPVVHASVAAIREQAGPKEDREDFVLALAGGKRVTFPHLMTMEFSLAEDIAITLQNARTTVALRKWLPKKDVDAILAQRFTLEEMAILSRLIGAHFADAFAELGATVPGMDGDLSGVDFTDDD